MKKYVFIAVITVVSYWSCNSLPKDFTTRYIGNGTGLDTLIDIDGYYISQFGCDTSFYSIYMFYSDGLFTIATTSAISDELTECFVNGGSSNICRYPSWGLYTIEGDTIKTQTIRPEGNKFTIFRDYLILPDKSIVNICDYVQPRYSNLGYLGNYPSFRRNECLIPAQFHKLSSKRSAQDCPIVLR